MVNKIIHTFITKGLSAGVNFFVAILLSRQLGPEGRGEAALLMSAVFLINVFTHFLSGSTLVYYASRFRITDLMARAYGWCLLVACFGSVGACYLYPPITGWGMDLFFLCILQGIFAANIQLLIGKEEVLKANLLLAAQALMLACTLVLLFFYFEIIEVNAYVWSLYTAYGSAGILSFLQLSQGAKEGPMITGVIGELGRKGFWNTIDNASLAFTQRLNLFFIDSRVGKAEAGVYANAYGVGEAIMMAVQSICMVQYARVANCNDDVLNRQITQKWAWVASGTTLLALLCIAVLPPAFFTSIFGPEFQDMKKLILLLGPGLLFFSYAQVINHYFSGNGRFRLMAFISSFGFVLLLSLSPFLIRLYGAEAAAAVMSISLTGAAMLSMYFYYFEKRGPRFRKMPVLTGGGQ